MNRSSITFLLIGVLVGCMLGFATLQIALNTGQPESTAAPSAITITNNVPTQTGRREKELLLQAIDELNLTIADLEAAQAKLKEQEESVRRYSWLMDKWAEKGFGNNYMSFRINSFNPGKGYAEFFGWNKEQVDKINQVAKTTSAAVKDWEAANAIYVETEEDKLVYELPPSPHTFKEAYLAAVADVVSDEDYRLLASKLEKQFTDIENGRKVSLYIGPPPEGRMHGSFHQSDKDWMIVEVQRKNNTSQGFFPSSTSMMPYVEGRTIPIDWNHIFQLEIDPNAADPTPIGSVEGMTLDELKAAGFQLPE